MSVSMLVKHLLGHTEDVKLLVRQSFDLIFTQFVAQST